MQAVLKESSPNHLSFIIVGCNTALANALRRTMISHVETWAIEYVSFKNNTTVLTDEFISHRLALIPLKGDSNSTKLNFTFDKTADNPVEEWYSGDMQTEDLEIPIKNIPIVKVNKGQTLQFTAVAKRGSGSIHSKWSPVSTCTFRKIDEGYLFTIETVYSMDPIDVLKNAIIILREKIKCCMNNTVILNHES